MLLTIKNALRNIFVSLLLLSSVLIGSNAVAEDKVQRFIHFKHQGEDMYGILREEKIYRLRGDLFDNPVMTGEVIELSNVELLPAVIPSKIIAVGLNFASHFGSTRGTNPRLFSKLPSSLTGTGEPIWLFPDSQNLHFEGELVIVIGKPAHRISPEQAPDYIFGVTVGK